MPMTVVCKCKTAMKTTNAAAWRDAIELRQLASHDGSTSDLGEGVDVAA
ncbi:hypothetical protein EV655_12221 [Rhodovulum euryhalinum]|uniref:Uncharacterized protein n=1 Tax=Rhodovulum euryhalinum TaxID=35805 RepID=A0A4R2K6F2_9RHOB|nr:hypothetical protein [Rhodovulum euryhalinum]TCO68843.1 hypothetical protein EV655_12221 [Rhodovulum euryhalinum]